VAAEKTTNAKGKAARPATRMPRPRPGAGAGRPLTADRVWRAAPPVGGVAWPTGDIADALGVRAGLVLPLLHELADAGRAQRLTREGTGTLWWRRQ
jgi:hypothetical protein